MNITDVIVTRFIVKGYDQFKETLKNIENDINMVELIKKNPVKETKIIKNHL